MLYLNDEWTQQDGGELVIYDLDDNQLATVAPQGGRLVVFLSEQFHMKYYLLIKKGSVLQGGFELMVSEIIFSISPAK